MSEHSLCERCGVPKRVEGVVPLCPACLLETLPPLSEPLPDQRSPDSIDDFLPAYERIRALGHGGSGQVFLARHRATDQHCAIKFLWRRYTHSPEARERFFREAEVMASLDHPNIVKVYDWGCHIDQPYLITEFCSDGDLEAYRRADPLQPFETLDILEQLCEGVAHAHERNIVHRDIKPSNVLLSGGVVKLNDFGLAKLAQAASTSCLTLEGAQLGTAYYVAPEQLEGGQVDFRADVYSIGILAYCLLTDHLPAGAFAPPSEFKRCGRALDVVVRNAIQTDTEKRTPTVPILKEQIVRARRHRICSPTIVTAAVLACALLAAGLALYPNQSPTTSVPFLDNFDNDNVLTNEHAGNIVTTEQGKGVTESGGALSFLTDGRAWSKASLESKETFHLEDEPVTFGWELNNIQLSESDSEIVYRIDLGLISADNQRNGRDGELLHNKKAGLYLRMDLKHEMAQGVPSTLYLNALSSGNRSDSENPFTVSYVAEMDLSADLLSTSLHPWITLHTGGFSAGLGETTLAVRAWEDVGFSARARSEFGQGFWALCMGKNGENGYGGHDLERFAADAGTFTPQPKTLLVDRFDDGNPLTSKAGAYSTVAFAGKSVTEKEEGLRFYPDGSKHWARIEYNSHRVFESKGDQMTFLWDIGDIRIHHDTPEQDYIVEVGVVSADMDPTKSAHSWQNTNGGLYMRMFFSKENDRVSFLLSTKNSSGIGCNRKGDHGIPSGEFFDTWKPSHFRTLGITISQEGYRFFCVGKFATPLLLWEDHEFGDEFKDGFWAFQAGTNLQAGKGGHLCRELKVIRNLPYEELLLGK